MGVVCCFSHGLCGGLFFVVSHCFPFDVVFDECGYGSGEYCVSGVEYCVVFSEADEHGSFFWCVCGEWFVIGVVVYVFDDYFCVVFCCLCCFFFL